MRTHALLFTALLGYAGVALAHGDVHERIHDLDDAIAHHPNDAALFIKRGQLFLDEGHADEARDDFSKARKLAPQRIEALYHLAQAQLMLKQPDAALDSAREFLRQATNDAARARGLVLTGDILSASGKSLAAAEAYLSAIKLSKEIKPDHVLYAADAFHTAGKTNQAIEVLNDGIARLGPLHALNDRALEVEMEQERYEPALRRVDRMLAARQRVPFLLYKKGLILKKLSRDGESRQTFAAALKEIDGLSRSRKQTPAFENLRTSLLAEMN
jgi:tetratricopeptide (TPR) repeat protein